MAVRDDQVLVTAAAHPFRDERVCMVAPAGLTLAQHVNALVADPFMRPGACVYLDGERIAPDRWAVVMPRPGQQIVINVMPMGGGRKILRSLLTIAVMVAAYYAAGAWGVSLAHSLTLGAGVAGPVTASSLAFASALIAGGITLAGTLVINALLPIKPPKPSAAEDERYSIAGVSNDYRPGAPIPVVLGKRRYYPPLAALPYTEMVGDDQYIRALFVLGYGPLEMSDWRIGTKPIEDFDDVQMEILQGWSDDPDIKLFPNEVTEDSYNILLESGVNQTVTTQADTDEASIDIMFPAGLVDYDKKGRRTSISVAVAIEYRAAGSADPWEGIPQQWAPGYGVYGQFLWYTNVPQSGHTFTGSTDQPKRFSRQVRFPSRGQWEIRIRRTTADRNDDTTIQDKTYLAGLRSIKHAPPVRKPGLALAAVRIRSSNQLNGTIDRLNCMAQRLYDVYDDGTESWITAEETRDAAGDLTPHRTRAAAAAYAYVLRGAATSRPFADDKIDMGSLLDWWADCEATHAITGDPKYYFDGVIEGGTTVGELLRDIALAGRASPHHVDGKIGVVQDRPQTTPVQMFTPRNSRGFSGSIQYVDLPHALKIPLGDEDLDNAESQVIVYADGYNEDGSGGNVKATNFELVEFPGVTRKAQAYHLGRYHMAVGQLRPELTTLEADLEAIVCDRGDLVLVQHDVPRWGLRAARIEALTTDGGGDVTAITLDETVSMEEGKTYACFIRRSANSNRFLNPSVVTDAGDHTTLTLAAAIPAAQAPDVGDLIVFGEAESTIRRLIVKALKPTGDNVWTLELVDEAVAVHLADQITLPAWDAGSTADPRAIPPGPVQNLILTENIRLQSGQPISEVVATWRAPADQVVANYEVYEVAVDGGFFFLTATTGTRAVLPVALVPGESITVRVVAVSPRGVKIPLADATEDSITLDGLQDGPDIINNLTALARVKGILLHWDNPIDQLNVARINIYRHTSDDRAAAEAAGVYASVPYPTDQYFDDLGAAALTRYYWARPVDANDNEGDWNASGGVSATSLENTADGVDWGDVSGAGKPDDDATRNDFYEQSTDPGSVPDGTYWYQTTTKLLRQRKSGAWVIIGSYNTGALADKNSADWATDVSGAAKPSDYATRNDIYNQTSDPGAVANGSYWYSSSTRLLKRREGGVWVTVGSYNTGALADKNTVGNSDVDNNAISTPKVQDNAVSVAGASTTTAETEPTAFTWSSLASVAITTKGGRTFISAFCRARIVIGSGQYALEYRIKRGSTVIFESGVAHATNVGNIHNLSFSESVAAGTYTYYFEVYPSSAGIGFSKRTLYVQDLAK